MAHGNKLFSLIFPTPIYGNPNNVFRLVTYLFLYFKRFEDPAHPLLKEMWIFGEESQTPKELVLQLTGNNEAIKMEGMSIMARLLGSMDLSQCKTRYRRTVFQLTLRAHVPLVGEGSWIKPGNFLRVSAV